MKKERVAQTIIITYSLIKEFQCSNFPGTVASTDTTSESHFMYMYIHISFGENKNRAQGLRGKQKGES
jgi:hypothetical protein